MADQSQEISISSVARVNQCVDVSKFFEINYKDQTAELEARASFAIAYSLILIFGLSGNILVVASVCRHRTLQTVRNFFIVSLSCSDLVVCLTSLPITPITFILKNWLFGSFLCYAFPLVQGMSVCISTFTLTAVAVDRYILIIFPTRKPIQRAQAGTMIASIWGLAAGVSVPMVVHYTHFYGPDRYIDLQSNSEIQMIDDALDNRTMDTTSINDDSFSLPSFCGYFCEEIWPSEGVRQIYGSFVMILQFVVPLTIISFCYAHICVRLTARNGYKKRKQLKKPKSSSPRLDDNPRLSVSHSTVPDITSGLNVCTAATTAVTSPSVTENRRRAVLRRKRRTNRMLIAMVVIFGICWAPQVLMNILRDLGELPTFVNDQMYFYSVICHIVAMSSTIWNPLLYSWMNETFRRSFLELLPCFARLQRKLSKRIINKRIGYANQPSTMADVDSRWDQPGATGCEPYSTLLIDKQKRKSLVASTTRNEDNEIGNNDNSQWLTLAAPQETKPLLNNDNSNFTASENGTAANSPIPLIKNQDDLTPL